MTDWSVGRLIGGLGAHRRGSQGKSTRNYPDATRVSCRSCDVSRGHCRRGEKRDLEWALDHSVGWVLRCLDCCIYAVGLPRLRWVPAEGSLEADSLFHGVVIGVWGFVALHILQGENPQILRLLVVRLATTCVYFWCLRTVEKARDELDKKQGIKTESSTQVLKELPGVVTLCKEIGRIDLKPVRRLRRRLASYQPRGGKFSWGASMILFGPGLIFLISGAMALGAVFTSMPLTPIDPPPPQPPIAGSSDCGADYDPGRNVPEPERSSLILAWHDLPDIDPGPLEALTNDVAGCPHQARRIPGSKGSWYAPGYCRGEELRAIVIAPEG